jgi:hypothetical protein
MDNIISDHIKAPHNMFLNCLQISKLKQKNTEMQTKSDAA